MFSSNGNYTGNNGDGNVEIIAAFEVFDANGARLFGIPSNGTEFQIEDYWCPTSTAARCSRCRT